MAAFVDKLLDLYDFAGVECGKLSSPPLRKRRTANCLAFFYRGKQWKSTFPCDSMLFFETFHVFVLARCFVFFLMRILVLKISKRCRKFGRLRDVNGWDEMLAIAVAEAKSEWRKGTWTLAHNSAKQKSASRRDKTNYFVCFLLKS